MTNDRIQDLRRLAEYLAPDVAMANRVRFTVYAWQDEGVPLDEQERMLEEIVSRFRRASR